MPQYEGRVTANLISLRFPESGRLAWLKCYPGLIVKKDAPLASLDPRPIQAQLDIELADFRRVRAEFDKLSRKLPEGRNEDERGEKEIAQSKLDVSVKAVEKSKLQLDSLTLYAPAAAVIISTEGLIPGINITPSGFPIILVPLDSAVFEVILPEEDFYGLKPAQKANLSLKTGFSTDSEVIYLSPQSESKNGFFTAHFRLPALDLSNFRLGTTGKVTTLSARPGLAGPDES